MSDRPKINFYKSNLAYGCFSNFSKHATVIDGVEWPTTEHYYQAQKFEEEATREMIRALNHADKAARRGRRCQDKRRENWEEMKIAVMRKALEAKVDQHPEIRAILLSTGNLEIVEHTDKDSYWADGGDGSGLNMLGILLMEIRDQLPDASTTFYVPMEMQFCESSEKSSVRKWKPT